MFFLLKSQLKSRRNVWNTKEVREEIFEDLMEEFPNESDRNKKIRNPEEISKEISRRIHVEIFVELFETVAGGISERIQGKFLKESKNVSSENFLWNT